MFYSDADRRLYLNCLADYSRHYGVSVEAYCLMENHVHFVVVPHSAMSLPRMMQRLASEYARHVHSRRDTAGHLWRARYYSVVLDPQHYWTAMVYVEQNPARAGVVQFPWQWHWSSAAAHVGMASAGLLNLVNWRAEHTPESWRLRLEIGLRDAALVDRIREATVRGWPLGNDEFLNRLESQLDVPVRPSPGGRPKKPAASHGSGISLVKTAS